MAVTASDDTVSVDSGKQRPPLSEHLGRCNRSKAAEDTATTEDAAANQNTNDDENVVDAKLECSPSASHWLQYEFEPIKHSILSSSAEPEQTSPPFKQSFSIQWISGPASNFDAEVCSLTMADTAPPPPPLPGTSGAPVMPHWRETYQPHLEAVPSRNQIEKQQYAHLPDKLLNTLNKDKKPFTYTPQGVSR